MKIKAYLALLLLFCILLPAVAQTQEPGAPPPPPQQKTADDKDDVVKITTNLVQLDAVVTKDGKPVTDLTADDFEIYQDGKKQTITSFAYISNVPGTIAPTAPRDKKAEVPPGARRVNSNEPRRIMALVVDDLGMSAQSIGLARRQLKKFVNEQLDPNDLVAIIRTGGELGVLQQLTNDKRVLMRAIERLRWNHCSRVGMDVFVAVGSSYDGSVRCGGYSLNNTLTSLHFIIDGLAHIPGRKSLVLLSDELPRENQELGFEFGPAGARSLGGPVSDSPGRVLDDFTNTRDYAGLLQKVAEKAIRASVVIYSIDTQALPVIGPTAADRFGDGRNITEQINQMLSSRSALLWRRREGSELMAKQTGGYQIRNSNSFKLDQIMQDQSGYYLIGYRPAEETFNRRFHKINAKVKRSGMTLRTRFGFYGVTEEEATKLKPAIADVTNLALASPFAARDIELDITSFFANDKTAGSIVRSFVYLAARDITFTPVGGRQQASFDLHGVVFGDNGTIVAHVVRGATLTLSEGDYEHALANGMNLTFDIPVKSNGAFLVRIAARDRATSRIGSAGEFVVVPKLSNKKMAVSGIILGTASDATGQELANPGARRFAPNSEVYFVYAIYNATTEKGARRNLVMQAKVYRDGEVVYTGPEVPVKGIDNLPDPSRQIANGSVRLPAELGPGSYYLQIAVSEIGVKNKVVPVVQWVDFEIQN